MQDCISSSVKSRPPLIFSMCLKCISLKAYGELMDCQPSRFLDELPADDLEWEGRADKEDPEKKQARGKDAIAGLRSLLG